MSNTLASKTVQVALVFAGMGILLIFADAGVDAVKGEGLRYVPEFFVMLTGIFVALAGKNAVDNYYASSERKTVIMTTGQVPPNAPPQPTL